jgi:MFS family permease
MAGGFRAAGSDRHTALVLGALAGHSVARGALGTLLVVLPLELLELGDSGVGLLLAVLAVGGLAGALAAAALAGRRRLAGPMGLGIALAAGPLLLAAALPATAVVLVAVVVVGGGFSLVSVVGTSLLVRAVRDDVLSRVLGVLQTVRAVGMAVGAGVTPLLLGAFGLRWTLAATGAGLALVLLAVRGGLREIDASSAVPVSSPCCSVCRSSPRCRRSRSSGSPPDWKRSS